MLFTNRKFAVNRFRWRVTFKTYNELKDENRRDVVNWWLKQRSSLFKKIVKRCWKRIKWKINMQWFNVNVDSSDDKLSAECSSCSYANRRRYCN